MGVTYVFLLSTLALAIHTQAQGCPTPVAGDGMKLQGNFNGSQTFQNGQKVTFACIYSYISVGGSPSIICTDGLWSPLRLKCEMRTCGSAGEIQNGIIDYAEGIEFGNKLVVTCNIGYNLVGKSEIFCGHQGWMSRLPECLVVNCLPPSSDGVVTFKPDKEYYEYQEVVQYSCPNHLTLFGSNSLACSEDETFKPDPPTCVMVLCEDPNINNGNWVEGSRPPFKYMSTVTFECISGYTMTGERNQACGINSQWLPGLPTCEPVQCEDPKIQNADRVDGSWPPYKYKSTVTFKCISGYAMKGARIQTCEIGGQWSPGLPTCRLIPTTTRPTTKKSIVDSDPTSSPANNGNGKTLIGLGIGLTVFTGVVIFCVCYCCGVLAIIKKRRSRRGSPVIVLPEEEVALA
ncbi:membrane cofactor protein-like isoform X2 [Cyclopterus lumpus]|uniref:Regulator of complement activation group 2 gene 1 n=1 Tax=Cyclopterus lumpus TaxID=8103 RepID=A0A8C2WT29_CYCLU|nr:membrane cofactor protein-like isoform X2 [Cyclopterus lumpus]XP_034392588.1 membrane cofactor protein-like isoform X2 [Cyclopterus lumpus]